MGERVMRWPKFRCFTIWSARRVECDTRADAKVKRIRALLDPRAVNNAMLDQDSASLETIFDQLVTDSDYEINEYHQAASDALKAVEELSDAWDTLLNCLAAYATPKTS